MTAINQLVTNLVGLVRVGIDRRGDRGQGLAEYALILALIALVTIVAVGFLGTQVTDALSKVGQSVADASS